MEHARPINVPQGFDAQALIRSSTYCAMVHAVHHLEREVAPQLAEVLVSSAQYLVLGQALAKPGIVTAELARECGLSPQHTAAVLDGLEKRGLVHRVGARGKGRPTEVNVTEAGVELLLAGWPIVHAAGADRLSATQHRILQELVAQLRGDDPRPDDVVVLVGPDGRDAGTAPRATVHTVDTPLHRAFSTYLRRPDGRVLMTRRALHKRTWPGVWTNSACGHVLPGETEEQAALRRVPQELGAVPTGLRTSLRDFRYRAVDASGIVEHEVCPVLVGEVDPDALDPDPDEVVEHAWVEWGHLQRVVAQSPFLISPWCVEQVAGMGQDPWA